MTVDLALIVRDARADERAWIDGIYASIDFAATEPDAVQLVAVRDGAIVGLGRLGPVGASALGGAIEAELGGMWTAASARGGGVASAMVAALLARAAPAAVLWCVPFAPLVDYYARFGFAVTPPPWPPGITHKVKRCHAHGQDVAIMRLTRMPSAVAPPGR